MWPTPTPIPTPGAPAFTPFDPVETVNTFTDWILQGWRLFDSSPIATVIFIGLILMIIYFGIMSIRAHLEQL